jgi:hypothetical protein
LHLPRVGDVIGLCRYFAPDENASDLAKKAIPVRSRVHTQGVKALLRNINSDIAALLAAFIDGEKGQGAIVYIIIGLIILIPVALLIYALVLIFG